MGGREQGEAGAAEGLEPWVLSLQGRGAGCVCPGSVARGRPVLGRMCSRVCPAVRVMPATRPFCQLPRKLPRTVLGDRGQV